MYDFGLKMRELRKKQKYTQSQLANKLCVSESLISRYENNLAQPPFETLRAIAAVFNVSMDELCGMSTSNDTVLLTSLTQNQKNAVKNLINVFRELNFDLNDDLVSKKYNVLGSITAELLKETFKGNI